MSKTEPIEVRDMAIVHRTFRNAYAEAARLVRARPTPSAERVTFLADHIDFGIAMLHHHHEAEDELLYPLLIERVPEQAGTTDEVAKEHLLVQASIEAAKNACSAWRNQPSEETGEALAASLDELNVVLQPHLDDEEQKVVPLAAVTLTQAEWDALGEHAQAGIPRDKMAVAFGMLLEPLDESDRAFMKRGLPLPVRMLFPLMIQRPWKKYASTLREGT
ncbi:hemerythrin domain-containing protein [Nocardioides guangzhouensis]|uniref:Hemerythrin domain-containing protein n=1 Tax=Nocardioides guangzhouensis TaxID=2497878 RepID=A0A4Q4ZFN0_9ACTN|nr:hemerythrin domain-containing protein [Nocardioides guangzhouensis]RYP86927.1 hemerythrin domain-containing protein [Nocardioides guangzhouensis]